MKVRDESGRGIFGPSVFTIFNKEICHWTLHAIKTNTKIRPPSMHCVQVVKVILSKINIFFNPFSDFVKNTILPCVEILPEVSSVNANLVMEAQRETVKI